MCHPNEWDTSLGTPGLVVQSTVSFSYPELIANGAHQLSWQLSMSCYHHPSSSSFTQLSPDHSCNINSQSFLWREIYLWNRLLPSLDSLQERKRYYWTLYTLTPHILSLTKIILLESWKWLLSICNCCKTMKNVLGHTHVMILCYYSVHWERGGLIWGWGDTTKERVSGLKISKDLSIPHTLYIISEFTQQDGRKKRTANRLCVTNVTRLYLGCFVVILTNINVFGSFTKRSV